MNTFSELELNPALHRNLARNLFTQPTPVQALAIPPALDGADVVATAQTGTGKTLAFVLPIIQKLTKEPGQPGVRTLILAPTRELALQISDSFEKIAPESGLRSAVVVGGMSEQTQLSALRRGAQVVIATPGRLEDFLDRRLINLKNVCISVLDEADRMLDMGFQPAIEKILAGLPKTRQSLFFSATMDETVERLIRKYSTNPIRISAGNPKTKTPDEVDLHLYEVESDNKIHLLRHMLNADEGSFLVFARTKHGTDRLTKKLTAAGVKAVAMHGDRTQNQRNQALAGFRDGRYRVLVATDVAARGIHVDSVAHVINFDLPQTPDDFVHRVGRTGRAGQRGSASTFASRSERGELSRIERECKIRLTKREITPAMMKAFAEATAEASKQMLENPKSAMHHHDSRPAHGKNKPFGGPKSFGGSKQRENRPKWAGKSR